MTPPRAATHRSRRSQACTLNNSSASTRCVACDAPKPFDDEDGKGKAAAEEDSHDDMMVIDTDEMAMEEGEEGFGADGNGGELEMSA